MGNQEFQQWTEQDGWEQARWHKDGAPAPSWDESVELLWSAQAQPLETVEEFSRAFEVLFSWREVHGMEASWVVRRRLALMQFPYGWFESCSNQTKSLADIYEKYYYRYAGNVD